MAGAEPVVGQDGRDLATVVVGQDGWDQGSFRAGWLGPRQF